LGSIIKIVGMLIIIGGLIFSAVGGYWGIHEAMQLDGPSQYDQLYLAAKIGGATIVLGLAMRWIGHWIIRRAPPLEEVKLPIDTKGSF
jgi:ABC-type antimicrobial peptide transport system permease subunit